MNSVKKLIPYLEDEELVYIQTHNFPDHDAVASAFALQELLKTQRITTQLIYEGTMQRESLKSMVTELEIPISHASEHPIKEEDLIVIVDGCKGNKNVTDLIGDEVAVIDHHQVSSPDDVRFQDIRKDYGACSSIIYSYFQELGVDIPSRVASAMMIGLEMDTAMMTRGVSQADLEAYSDLYHESDTGYVNSALRNYIQVKDLKFYRMAIDKVKILERAAFCHFEDGCNQNMLGILGDFFLSLMEVDFVFLSAKNGGQVNFSLRSEIPEWNAGLIVQHVLAGIGFGGGHADMAGGIIKEASLFNEQKLREKTLEMLI